jgi:DNA modification methylase
MNIENWPIDRPTPYPRNARKLSPQAIEKVAASLQEFGWRQPIVVDSKGVVICGHTRLLAARSLGAATVPVHVAAELTPAQVKAYRLMDNRSHEETSWESTLLGGELFDLKGLDFDLGLTGFNPGEIDGYLAALDVTAGLTDEDAVPEIPERPVTVAGDLWLLGHAQHKLLVGDATDPAAVARLMAGDSADLIFTDPPYNVDYEGYTEERLKIKGDRMSDAEFRQFLEAAFRSCRAAVKPGASLYVCHSSSWQREFQNALESVGFEVRCQIIWAKNTFAWGFGRYKFQHEPLFYAHVAGQKDPWYGDKSQSTLWEEKKPAANRLHPTAKPVELIERALLNSSKAGDIVADLFGGSGSTLIACERRGRKARLMELDPRYADVIVRRYQEYSGKPAVLDEDGRTFHEIARQRLKEAA